MYTDLGLPVFYPFVRIVITHIALRIPDAAASYRRTTFQIDKILKLHVADKGCDGVYHVAETERRLWKISGMIPPPYQSEAERLWAEENQATPYDGAY
ncbi:hypothetical protein NUU61_008621 [Penicillium alfredii]|uniref:Tautomerase cis-CaaD-like domain-containing protein n=1 Tax=Penicillium alfredii TaxID=1506179 RepID=A0A9W9ELH9_9EURO|nr:uncharacterized protein NUU61_008621 [Penicillium alfredii]KAJ5084042.1 hypothetical protein NUU61_008621 [Penicillium alfredii]